MSDWNNPYASPTEPGGDQESDGTMAPDYRTLIRCSGHHRPDDCWMSFTPHNFLTSMRKATLNSLTAVGFGVILMAMLLLEHRFGERIHPFWFFVFGTIATPVWWWVWSWIREWTTATQLAQRRHYLQEGPFEGRLDQHGITVITESAHSRATWQFFKSVNLLTDRIELPIPGTTHRWILPTRFFASADEYHDAARLIADRLGVTETCPKKTEVISQPYRENSGPAFPQIDQAHLWTTQYWPFDPGPEIIEFSYRPALPKPTFAHSCRVALSLIRDVLFTALPMVLAFPLWLLSDYLHFRDWAFLTDATNLWFLAPTVMLLLVGGWLLYQGYHRAIQSVADVQHTAISESGCAFVLANHAAWRRWDTEVESISTESLIGLRTADDEISWQRDLLDSDVVTRLEQLLQCVAERTQRESRNDN